MGDNLRILHYCPMFMRIGAGVSAIAVKFSVKT